MDYFDWFLIFYHQSVDVCNWMRIFQLFFFFLLKDLQNANYLVPKYQQPSAGPRPSVWAPRFCLPPHNRRLNISPKIQCEWGDREKHLCWSRSSLTSVAAWRTTAVIELWCYITPIMHLSLLFLYIPSPLLLHPKTSLVLPPSSLRQVIWSSHSLQPPSICLHTVIMERTWDPPETGGGTGGQREGGTDQ